MASASSLNGLAVLLDQVGEPQQRARTLARGRARPAGKRGRVTGHEEFFGRRRETVDPVVAAGRRRGIAAVPEQVV
jgi:hypothetical protein